MNTLTLKLYTSDYEGNSQYYDVTIDLETWKVESKESYGKVRYAPHVQVQSVEIFMQKEFLKKKGVRGNSLDLSKYDLS